MLSVISIVITPAITFDPDAWIVWARELTGPLVFSTTGGPSWHPGPVFMIMPFTLITSGHADVYYWLLISRFGTMLSLVGAIGLGSRLAGLWAGILAAVLIAISPRWLFYGMVGTGAGMSTGLWLCAIWAHVEGRYRLAGLLLFVVGLIRPEVWPFMLLYLAWMGYRRIVPRWLLVAALGGLGISWFIPEIVSSGTGAFTAAMSAPPMSDGIHARIPFIRVIEIAIAELGPVTAVLAGVGLVATLQRWLPERARSLTARLLPTWLGAADPLELALVAIGGAWIVEVALMTQLFHLPGNARYLLPGAVPLMVVAGAVAVRLARNVKVLIAGPQARIAVVAVIAVVLAGLAGRSYLSANVNKLKIRTDLVAQMKREIVALNCPGRVWTQHRAPWLAELTGETTQMARLPGWAPKLANGHLVACALPPPSQTTAQSKTG